jgi:anthranilate synthase
MWAKSAVIALLATAELSSGFTVQKDRAITSTTSLFATVPDFNAVDVAKTGGAGAVSASQKAVDQDLSLGAPRGRPNGGHFMTKGGIQVTANVQGLQFSKSNQPGTSEAAIDHLIDQLDSHKGVLLTSSYEFPGRYARWSLGFVDPPLEVSGKADKCTIKALNERGRVLMPAIEQAMKKLKQEEILSDLQSYQPSNGEKGGITQIDVTVVPPPEVGTFSEEERSRQVRSLCDAEQVQIPMLFFHLF